MRAEYVAVMVAVLTSWTGSASGQSREPPAGEKAPTAYKAQRSDEDYRYLRDPERRTDLWDRFKLIPLGRDPSTYVTLGGELRGRFESYHNPDFNFDGTEKRNTYLLRRTLLHADLHLGPSLRIFGQLGSSNGFGEAIPLGPTQEDRFDAQQGFVDLMLPLGAGRGSLTLRGGRQEMAFGSSRLVSVREGPNVRLSFDGARAFWRSEESGFRVDAFATRPVELREGIFEDRSNPRQAFWGVYATGPLAMLAPNLSADLYYLGYKRDRARFAQGTADERRHTFGTRLFGKAGNWDWDFEAAYQTGSFGRAEIGAFTIASETGYTFANLPWAPRLALKADIASGDARAGDAQLGTFNPLFPKLPYFTEATLNAPANLMDVYPSLTLAPSSGINLTVGWDFLWRHRTGDAFYLPPLVAIEGTVGEGRFIGHQVQVLAQWQATRHLELRAAYTHFTAGKTIRKAGGRDVDFVLLSAAYKW